jgi:hypothetical protein
MSPYQKDKPKSKPGSGARGSRSPSDQDLTCSEAQLDDLLSEGESTRSMPSTSKAFSKVTLITRSGHKRR